MKTISFLVISLQPYTGNILKRKQKKCRKEFLTSVCKKTSEKKLSAMQKQMYSLKKLSAMQEVKTKLYGVQMEDDTI